MELDSTTTRITKTTLYGLIEAIQEEVASGEDKLVVEVVSQMLRGGRIRLPFSSDLM